MPTQELAPPNANYGIFSDWDKSLKRWFTNSYKTELKNVHIDHVLNGTTCQPISLKEFQFFLQNKEHSAENLDFYFWYLGYKKRFEKLSEDEKAKSPPPKERPSPGIIYNNPNKANKDDKQVAEEQEKQNQLIEQQPFREEIEAIILTFFHEDSFKELNLDSYLSRYVTYYSQQTTHPDIFEDVHQHIYNILKTSSFPNFIHHATQNIRYTFYVIEYAGVFFNLLHIPVVLYYTYSHHMSRWYRLSLFWFCFFFSTSLLSGRAGFCTIRGFANFRQVPLYEFSEYKVERGTVEKFIKNGPVGLPLQLQEQQLLPEQDAEKTGKKKKKKSLTEILDPEVLKYGRQMWWHIIIAGIIFSAVVTIIGVSITNEYDVPPAPPMPP
ncbi:hypothetical protein [Parasitella parasitica]|uniref:RGS domain-containing protein n=1 Tax=Parasitella parasitica TaxID=35722 RepID=A0A0B7N550_9FUNG|nr:hypothetical protein [Parasitella parasitica]